MGPLILGLCQIITGGKILWSVSPLHFAFKPDASNNNEKHTLIFKKRKTCVAVFLTQDHRRMVDLMDVTEAIHQVFRSLHFSYENKGIMMNGQFTHSLEDNNGDR